MKQIAWILQEPEHKESQAKSLRLLQPLLDAFGSQFDFQQKFTNEVQSEKERPQLLLYVNSENPLQAIDVVKSIKRNPVSHHAGFFLVTEKEVSESDTAKKFGLLGTLKSENFDESKKHIDEFISQALDPKDLAELDLGFAEDALDQVDKATQLLAALDEGKAKELYRILHTIKGGSRSLQFFELAEFVHHVEGTLSQLIKRSWFQDSVYTQTFQEALGFIQQNILEIKDQKPLGKVPEELSRKMDALNAAIQFGWSFAGEGDGANAPAAGSATEASAKEERPAQTEQSKATSVRISNEKLEALHQNFKKILQIRTKLNAFYMSLNAEFQGEAFPAELGRLVENLNQETANGLDFFVSLRVVPASRLRNFSERVFNETLKAVGKKAKLHFDVDATLELDQSVIEILENSLTHLLRNSLDHGIEAPEQRLEKGKSEEGNIKVNLQKEGRERFVLTVKDDGKGIDPQGLKAAMLRKGVMDQKSADLIPEDRLLDLIFVDGLSMKEEVTDVSGRGVGLGAVKQRITEEGGSVTVQSTVGSGTEFTIIMKRVFKL